MEVLNTMSDIPLHNWKEYIRNYWKKQSTTGDLNFKQTKENFLEKVRKGDEQLSLTKVTSLKSMKDIRSLKESTYINSLLNVLPNPPNDFQYTMAQIAAE